MVNIQGKLPKDHGMGPITPHLIDNPFDAARGVGGGGL
jgi:hypothetical protein